MQHATCSVAWMAADEGFCLARSPPHSFKMFLTEALRPWGLLLAFASTYGISVSDACRCVCLMLCL